MKELRLKRTELNSQYTVGKLYYNDVYICDTLEDTYRDLSKEQKVYGKTAIPEGEYKIRLNYSPKFKRTMPYLLDVPHFTYIMIHWGNTVKDTAGCILVGENKGKVLINSRKTFEKVFELIKKYKVSTLKVEVDEST